VVGREGHADVVNALIKAGANTDLRNKKRETAYDIAVASGQSNVANLLK
jgi:ankyrin repeat protein